MSVNIESFLGTNTNKIDEYIENCKKEKVAIKIQAIHRGRKGREEATIEKTIKETEDDELKTIKDKIEENKKNMENLKKKMKELENNKIDLKSVKTILKNYLEIIRYKLSDGRIDRSESFQIQDDANIFIN